VSAACHTCDLRRCKPTRVPRGAASSPVSHHQRRPGETKQQKVSGCRPTALGLGFPCGLPHIRASFRARTHIRVRAHCHTHQLPCAFQPRRYVQALDDSPCPTPVSQRVIETDVVSFYAVSGLWVILAATVLFAVLLLAVRYAVLLARSSGRPAAGAPPPGQYPYRAAATAVAPWAPPSKPKAEADAAQSGGGAAAAAFSDGTGASTHGATLGGKAAGHAGVDSFAAAVAADGGKPLGATTAALRAAALGLSLPSSAGADAELGSENCSERSTPGAPPLHRPLFSLSSADDLPPPAFPDVRQKSQSGGVGNRGTPAEQQPLADELLPKRQSGSGRRSAGSAGAGSPATPPQLRPGSELRPSSGLRPGSGVQPGSGVRPVSGSGAAAQPVATAGVGGQPAAAPQARAGTVPGVPHVTNQAPSESQFPYGEKDSEV